jgi:RNA polymerase sigma-70 factor (ECF subfamily)
LRPNPRQSAIKWAPRAVRIELGLRRDDDPVETGASTRVRLRATPTVSEARSERSSWCSTLSDDDLIQRIGGGEETAVDVLYRRYREPAVALAQRFCSATLAEEAVQEAFLQIAWAPHSYRSELGPARTWILAIVRNRAIDALRRDTRHSSRRAEADRLDRVHCPEDVETIVDRRDQARMIRSLLLTLPEDQARIIDLAYFGELTHAEIARETGLPIGTVKGRIRLGLAKARESLQPDSIARAASVPV